MHTITLKNLMVPVQDYASIAIDASITEGIHALKQAQQQTIENDPDRHRDRAVLVMGEDGKVAGKLSMWSIIGCLEPGYERKEAGAASQKAASRSGSANAVIEDMLASSHLWRNRLGSIAAVAGNMKIKDVYHPPRENELIDLDAPLEQAMHQLVAGHFMSLLVRRDERVVGVLRLVDVFEAVCRLINDNEPPQ